MASEEQIETFQRVVLRSGISRAIDAVTAMGKKRRSAISVLFLRQVCVALGVTPKQLQRGGRCPAMADARHVAAWIVIEATGATYAAVGEAFGGQHHTSIMHAWKRVQSTPRLLQQARDILTVIRCVAKEAA